MFYLVATILLNVFISVMFKLFPKYKIDTLQAIVTNYCVCVATGCIATWHIPFNNEATHSEWLPWALGMGAAFICIFNLLAYSTKVDGITTTIIASKLSLVIPVIFSLIVYREHTTVAKIIGILLAFPAVYLTTRVEGDDHKPQNLLWPVLIHELYSTSFSEYRRCRGCIYYILFCYSSRYWCDSCYSFTAIEKNSAEMAEYYRRYMCRHSQLFLHLFLYPCTK